MASRSLDRNNTRLRVECVDSSRTQRNRTMNATINTVRLVTTELEVQGRRSYLKPQIRESGRTQSQKKPATQVLIPVGSDPNYGVYVRARKPIALYSDIDVNDYCDDYLSCND